MENNIGINEQIKNFAKANKVSSSKLQEFITSLIQANSSKVGRKASEETLKVREAFATEYKGFSRGFTSKDVSSKYGIPLAEANNLLNFYAKQGKVKVCGKMKIEGQRGKPCNQWEVA